ncbi:MAG: EI24 domain-containing protein [Acidobacteriota bacterium]
MTATATHFLDGLSAALRGARMAWQSKAMRRTYLQLVLAILGGTLLLQGGLGLLVWRFTDIEPSRFWWTLLRWTLLFVVLVASPAISFVVIRLGVPLLSERVLLAALKERHPNLHAELLEREGLSTWRSLRISLGRLIRYVLCLAGLLVLSFVPLVGALVVVPLKLLLTAWVLGSELLDPYMSLSGMNGSHQRQWLHEHRATVVGFGLTFSLFLAVPLVGIFSVALGQSAAAVLLGEVLVPRDERLESEPSSSPVTA